MNLPENAVQQVLPLMEQPEQQRIMELEEQLEKERKEHEETKEKLETLEDDKCLFKLNVKLLQENEELIEKFQEAEKVSKEFEEQIEKKDKEMAQMKTDFAESCLKIQKDVKKGEELREILENKLEMARDALGIQSEAYIDQIAKMKEANQLLEQKVVDLEDQLDRTTKMEEELRQNLALAQKNNENELKNYKLLEKNMEHMKENNNKQYKQIENAVKNYETREESRTKMEQDLKNKLTQSQDTSQRMENKVRELEQQNKELTQRIERKNQTIKDLHGKVVRRDSKVQELEKKLSGMTNTFGGFGAPPVAPSKKVVVGGLFGSNHVLFGSAEGFGGFGVPPVQSKSSGTSGPSNKFGASDVLFGAPSGPKAPSKSNEFGAPPGPNTGILGSGTGFGAPPVQSKSSGTSGPTNTFGVSNGVFGALSGPTPSKSNGFGAPPGPNTGILRPGTGFGAPAVQSKSSSVPKSPSKKVVFGSHDMLFGDSGEVTFKKTSDGESVTQKARFSRFGLSPVKPAYIPVTQEQRAASASGPVAQPKPSIASQSGKIVLGAPFGGPPGFSFGAPPGFGGFGSSSTNGTANAPAVQSSGTTRPSNTYGLFEPFRAPEPLFGSQPFQSFPN